MNRNQSPILTLPKPTTLNMAASLPARVLVVWVITLVTTVFLVIRLDRESNWKLFIVFIPTLLFEGVLLFVIISRIIRHDRRRFHDDEITIKRKIWFLLLLILNFIFICLVCAKLDGLLGASFSWYYVFIFLWIFLILVSMDATRELLQEAKR